MWSRQIGRRNAAHVDVDFDEFVRVENAGRMSIVDIFIDFWVDCATRDVLTSNPRKLILDDDYIEIVQSRRYLYSLSFSLLL